MAIASMAGTTAIRHDQDHKMNASTPVYRHADEAAAIIRDLIETDHDHHHLKQCGAIVGALFHVHNTPLKAGGRTCAAYVKKTSYQNRVLGHPDAVIVIDFSDWDSDSNTDEQKRALIDHELYHLMPKIEGWDYVRDANGERIRVGGEFVRKSARYEYDDAHRPKLDMRKHDIEVGWFARMLEKHGPRSAEARQASVIVESYGQLCFGFAAATEKEIQLQRMRHFAIEEAMPSSVAEEMSGAHAGMQADLAGMAAALRNYGRVNP